MKRTTERVLSIISLVFTVFGIMASFMGIAFIKMFSSNSEIMADFEAELLTDPAITPTDIDGIYSILDVVIGFSGIIIAGLVISFIVTLIGTINIWNNKKPKLAGILFIIGGLFAGILSITSILLYITGILCLVKKVPMINDNPYSSNTAEDSMRPL
ncbi:DUF4064 domain-containing protein [Sporosarcina sp. CAU 1771]